MNRERFFVAAALAAALVTTLLDVLVWRPF